MTGPTHEEKGRYSLPGKLSHDEMDTLLHFARVESYPAGKEIYAKGSLGRSMISGPPRFPGQHKPAKTGHRGACQQCGHILLKQRL
jgi:hypothetical protein